MSPAKVTLSTEELELVNNAGWILTKNAIIGKVYALFGQLNHRLGQLLENHPILNEQNTAFLSPKISKGEQYEGLPWVMLDQPRYFRGDDALAIRSFFWWGNCCSITLHISGEPLKKYAPYIQTYFTNPENTLEGWLVCIGTNPWLHHFREDNYRALEVSDIPRLVSLPFLKLAKKTNLQHWDTLPVFFENAYVEILEMLKTQ